MEKVTTWVKTNVHSTSTLAAGAITAGAAAATAKCVFNSFEHKKKHREMESIRGLRKDLNEGTTTAEQVIADCEHLGIPPERVRPDLKDFQLPASSIITTRDAQTQTPTPYTFKPGQSYDNPLDSGLTIGLDSNKPGENYDNPLNSGLTIGLDSNLVPKQTSLTTEKKKVQKIKRLTKQSTKKDGPPFASISTNTLDMLPKCSKETFDVSSSSSLESRYPIWETSELQQENPPIRSSNSDAVVCENLPIRSSNSNAVVCEDPPIPPSLNTNGGVGVAFAQGVFGFFCLYFVVQTIFDKFPSIKRITTPDTMKILDEQSITNEKLNKIEIQQDMIIKKLDSK